MLPGSENPGFFNKAQLTRFYWVLGFIGFLFLFLFEWAVGKLVGWFGSSAKLLFRLASTVTLDYLKICEFITYCSLEAVNIKKSSIITGSYSKEGAYGWHGHVLPFQKLFPAVVNSDIVRCWILQRWHFLWNWTSSVEKNSLFCEVHDFPRISADLALTVTSFCHWKFWFF